MLAIKVADPEFDLLAPLAQRIYGRVIVTPGPLDTPCLIWQGCVNSAGYGLIKVRLAPGNRVVMTVHRLLYRFASMCPIPRGKVIGHACDRKLCCEFTHLAAITHGQNLRDAWARLRRTRPRRFTELAA